MATQDSIVSGLFATPEQLQMAQRAQVEAQLAKEASMDPYERASYLAGMSGYGLGKLAGGIMGAQDPQLKAAATIQQLAGEFDTGTSKGMADFANALREKGLYGPAAQFAAQVAPLRLKEAEATAKLREQVKVEKVGLAQGTKEPVYVDKVSNQQFVIRNGQRLPYQGGVDQTTSNVSFSPDIRMADKELAWRGQYLAENKPVIEQAASVQQALGLLQQSQQSPFADAAFANTVVSAFGGDKQKSKSEIDRLVKAGALDERVANTVKGFFEGTTSAKTKEDQLNVLTAVDKVLEQRYNNAAQSWTSRLSKAGVNPDLVVPGYREVVGGSSSVKNAALPPEGTRLRNKTTGKIEVVRNGKLIPE